MKFFEVAKGRDVRLHWVKAHVGIPGNEYADVAAKAATQADIFWETPNSRATEEYIEETYVA